MKNSFSRIKKYVCAFVIAAITMTNGVLSASAYSTSDLINSSSTATGVSAFDNIDAIDVRLSYHLAAIYGSDSATNDFSYGSAVLSYTLSDNNSKVLDSLCYPVYKNNSIIGTFRVFCNENGGYTYSYSESIPSNAEIALDEDCVLVSTEEGDYFEKDVLNSASRTNKITNSNKNVLNSIPENNMRGTPVILPIPTWNQGSTGLCWAGAVRAVGKYMTGINTYDPYDIADYMEIGYTVNDGATPSQMVTALDDLYDIQSTETGNVVSRSQIISSIDNDTPIIMCMRYLSPSLNLYHVITLKGYYEPQPNSSILVIIAMDTFEGAVRTLDSTSSYSYTYTTSGRTYYWYNSVKPN